MTILREQPSRRELFRATRERTRRLLEEVVGEDAYYQRPIALRHPIVFYEGHLPAFALNTLVKWALGRPGIDADFEVLFERGIDPEEETAEPAPRAWPERARVQEFARLADRAVEDALAADGARAALAVGTILEHELMHQETLLYMLHRLPLERLRPQGDRPRLESDAICAGGATRVPSGCATLGADPSPPRFGWDNEFPRQVVDVPTFEVDVLPVTNGDYLEFVESGGYQERRHWDDQGWTWSARHHLAAPLYWERGQGRWSWRALFEEVPLPLSWPVYVSHAEASAYCRFRGRRLLTEAEFHRAAFGSPEGGERPHPWGDNAPRPGHHGNFGFVSWDPWPVGSCPAGASAFGVQELVGNGWEWTATPFHGFPGFEPMASYPAYSSDFFDGRHYVLKGASPATAAALVRRTFRNWYRSRYPYPYAKFRTVTS
ncbi:MAG TPA: SUMF1/EgtB/PvdO family nonheme iron enzyme [Vicinamibacteria bacterium]|nr:SUMF1/EgtB/PvdO family nonheme iron enzyme [Vicinamibacteria bacterium]